MVTFFLFNGIFFNFAYRIKRYSTSVCLYQVEIRNTKLRRDILEGLFYV